MENKAEILQKLYNIRAGLSAVSVQKDEIERRENEISKAKEKIDSKHNAYVEEQECLEQEIDKNTEEFKSKTTSLASCKVELFNKNNAKDPKAHRRHWLWERNRLGGRLGNYLDFVDTLFLILFILSIALCIGSIVGIIFALTTGWARAQLGLIVFALLVGIALSVFFGCNSLGYITIHTKKDYEFYFEYTLPSKIKELKDWLLKQEQLKEKLQRLPVEHKNETVALQNRINSLQESNAPIITYANGMYDVVVKEYGSFLSVSDWQNLDYIIYLFETGRADTLKESLILLDEMKRHDMLMKAMGHIASTIRAGFGELNSTMMRGFSMMSSQLESLSSQMDSIRSAQQNSNALLGDLSKKMDVYSALCAKANTTSETMMKDVDYIKSRLSR